MSVKQMFRPRFSLKVLLVFAVVVGLGLVPFVRKLDRARRQRSLVHEIERSGGRVVYSWEVGSEWKCDQQAVMNLYKSRSFKNRGDGFGEKEVNSPEQSFMRRILGPDYFDEVICVQIFEIEHGRRNIIDVGYLRDIDCFAGLQMLDLRNTKNFDYELLPRLKKLESIYLQGSDIANTEPIGKVKSLKKLNLGRTEIVSLEHLSGLTQLKELSVIGTAVSDLSPLKGLTALEDLDVSQTQVTDLSPLRNLTRLTGLAVNDVLVDDFEPLRDLNNLEVLMIDTSVRRRLTKEMPELLEQTDH